MAHAARRCTLNLVERPITDLVVVLDEVSGDDTEMLLVEHEHVVETYSA